MRFSRYILLLISSVELLVKLLCWIYILNLSVDAWHQAAIMEWMLKSHTENVKSRALRQADRRRFIFKVSS